MNKNYIFKFFQSWTHGTYPVTTDQPYHTVIFGISDWQKLRKLLLFEKRLIEQKYYHITNGFRLYYYFRRLVSCYLI
jgi:hypothetical protein